MGKNKEKENYKTEYYEAIVPANVNSDTIFDQEKFEVRILEDEGQKIVFVKKKVKEG